MTEIIGIILLLIGTIFMFISALGLMRMPDLYLRMSASTKTSTIGVGTVLLAAAVYFNDLAIASRALAVIFFLLLTAPIAAHMIGRAAYSTGVPLWEGTRYDELKGKYDTNTQALAGDDGTASRMEPKQAP